MLPKQHFLRLPNFCKRYEKEAFKLQDCTKVGYSVD